MIDYNYLAELLFPDVKETPEIIEARYPARTLPEGAKVTRFAPSPTGYVHFGGLFPTMVAERLAHQSKGVFYLRIEDTDAKREVPGAAEAIITTLAQYGILFDEGAVIGDDGRITDKGIYGPFKQSMRGPIYHVFAKALVKAGKAYPCFTTEEELEIIESTDKKALVKSKEWNNEENERKKAEKLAMRTFTIEEVEEHIKAGHPFVLRILSNGDSEKKVRITDLIKGNLELPENDEDFVLLKSDGIPTYHFAHAVDDHLMGTTHVIRGEEWLPSLSKHIQLFYYLGFKLPKYMHIAQIMKLDENGNKKKLSKRDMGMNLEDYRRIGYDNVCICEYIMTLLNSNYEEWRAQNKDKQYTDFPFNIKKMSSSGCLLDFNKLNDVSKNIISQMSAGDVVTKLTQWAKTYDPEFASLLQRNPDYAKSIFAIGRGGKNPRKDLAVWSDARPYSAFFYDELFKIEDAIPDNFNKNDVKEALTEFVNTYDKTADANTWFENIKAICDKLGFASDMKVYKENPSAYKGSVANVSMFVRIAVTGKINSPDLYTVMQILGYERTVKRINNMIEDM